MSIQRLPCRSYAARSGSCGSLVKKANPSGIKLITLLRNDALIMSGAGASTTRAINAMSGQTKMATTPFARRNSRLSSTVVVANVWRLRRHVHFPLCSAEEIELIIDSMSELEEGLASPTNKRTPNTKTTITTATAITPTPPVTATDIFDATL